MTAENCLAVRIRREEVGALLLITWNPPCDHRVAGLSIWFQSQANGRAVDRGVHPQQSQYRYQYMVYLPMHAPSFASSTSVHSNCGHGDVPDVVLVHFLTTGWICDDPQVRYQCPSANVFSPNAVKMTAFSQGNDPRELVIERVNHTCVAPTVRVEQFALSTARQICRLGSWLQIG